MAELRFQKIDKHFGSVHAVRGLDLKVENGEFLVLLGPTGAGKTTTLRLAAGLEQPDAGRIFIAGREVTDLPPAARDVAFVFQNFSLYPHLTVYDNLAFPLRAPARRMPETEIRKRVEAVAELLRISAKLPNPATRLSGGEMQRVAIGRALVREPALFLMDEPLSSLDAKLREALRAELKRIQHELGATVLYVTHDQTEALTMADRIGVLEEGTLLQLGTPEEVYRKPADVRVAGRLGSPAINLLPAGAVDGLPLPAGTATVGVRPEDILLGEGPLAGRVRHVEVLGAETVVLLEMEGRTLRVLADASLPRAGRDVPFTFRTGQLLFFNQDGRRLDA